jgi:hypothetical protein
MEPPVESVFASSDPIVPELYAALLDALRALGVITAEPKKTSIHLVNRTGFAGVHPRKSYINVEFKSATPVEGTRIQKSEQISRNRFHNTVRLTSPAEIDRELLAWLRGAYELSA